MSDAEDNAITADLMRNVRMAERLVRIIADQRGEVADAYAAGWNDCGTALLYVVADAWQAGYAAAEADMDAAWTPVARQIRALGSPTSQTFAEKRAEELESCKPRPGDFPGLLADPAALDRYHADRVVPVRHDQREAAA